MIVLKTKKEIDLMYEAGQVNYACHMEIKKMIQPGVTTFELDELAEKFIRQAGGKPAFKGYQGYPATINASIDMEVVHGIPSKKRKLQEGEIIGIDLGTILNDYYADSAYTWTVGKVSDEKQKLVNVTEECLMLAIKMALPGNRIGDISWAVQEHAESNGFSVVRDMVGHGIGRKLHEDPRVPNYGKPGMGPQLRPGMVLAIEPMINAGVFEIDILEDDWTVVTQDGKPSGHFEHTVAITENGPRVLTAPEGTVKI
jgi:methionyl aminopeptidase